MTAPDDIAPGTRPEPAERHPRLLRLACLAFAVLAAAAMASCNSQPAATKEVVAERFVLKDAGGRTRATLTTVGGSPAFVLFDDKDRIRLGLTVGPDGAAVELLDADGKRRILVGDADREPRVSLYGPGAVERARLSIDPNGPQLSLSGADGRIGATVAVTGDGGGVVVRSPRDRAAVALEARDEFQRVTVRDGRDAPRAGIVVSGPESEIHLLDPDGRTLFSKP